MAQSYLNSMSHHQTQSQRPTSPMSVNYISAGSELVAPRFTPQAFVTPAPTQQTGKRFNVKAKIRKVFSSAKKNLQLAACLVRPGSSSSTASSAPGSMDYLHSGFSTQARHSAMTNFQPRASTPSICLTKPSYKGTNVRLSIHQAPPTPDVRETFLLDEVDSPESKDKRENRKSTMFQHPVVSHVIAGPDTSMASSTLLPGSQRSSENLGEQADDLRPSTATTVATVDFENQVNPKRVFRHSHAVSDGESYDTFKDVMDGVRAKSPPRAAAAAKLEGKPVILPYISLHAAITLDDGEISPMSEAATPVADRTLPATLAPAAPAVAHPTDLTPGSELHAPLPKPRTTAPRPHTTGEFFPGMNILPYMPYNPRFNPYNTTPPSKSPAVSQKPSANDLAAAFAEAEAAEQAVRHKRHTTLYADVESGFLPLTAPVVTAPAPEPTVPAPAIPTKSIKRKAVPKPLAIPKQTAPAAKHKHSRASKPLPALPSPGSPRRFTRGIVPAKVPSNNNSYPVVGESSKTKAKTTVKEKKAKRTVRAVEKALNKLL